LADHIEKTIDTAKALRTLMAAREITAKELALAYGCSTSHIHNMCKVGCKTIDAIETFSYHLDVDVKTFIEYGEIEND